MAVCIAAAPSGSVGCTAGQGLAGPPETGGLIPLAGAGATRETKREIQPLGVSAVFVWG